MQAWIFAAVTALVALPTTALAQSASAESTAADGSADDSSAARIGNNETTVTTSPSNSTGTVSLAAVSESGIQDRQKTVDLSFGTVYATGEFGSDAATSVVSSSVGARLSFDNLRLSASIPWMRIRTAGVFFTGIDSTPVLVSPAGNGPKRTYDGIGDLTLGAAYTLPIAASGAEVEVSGRTKLSTASNSSGLSSGKTDYSAGIQFTQPFGAVGAFASATFRHFGDPAAFDLKDGIAASAGASVIVGSRTVFLASYHFAEAASRFVKNAHELFAGISTSPRNSGLRLTGFVTAGLSAGAAGFSGGLAVAHAF